MRTARPWLSTLLLLCLVGPVRLAATPPELVLSLENHHDFYCQADALLHKNLAESGRVVLAREGSPHDEAKVGVHGIEEPLSYGLALLSTTHLHLCGDWADRRSGLGTLGSFFLDVRNNAFLREQWFRLRKDGVLGEGAKDAERTILEVLDRGLVPTRIGAFDLPEALGKMETSDKEETLRALFYRFGKAVVRDYNDRLRMECKSEVRLEAIDEKAIFGLPTNTEGRAQRERLVHGIRNEFMAMHIAKAYESARAGKVPLVVVLGANHEDEIRDLLAARLGSEVPIRTRSSRKAFHALFHSRSAADTVEELERHYAHLQPADRGFAPILEAAENASQIMLLGDVQKTMALTGCPRSLSLAEVVEIGRFIPGSSERESELRELAEIRKSLGGFSLPCAIL